MRVDLKSWLRRRENAMAKLEDHLKAGRVDEDMVSLLKVINSLPYAFTTSSCSGRIQLYEALEPGEKFGIRTLGKWHEPIKFEEILARLDIAGNFVWLAVLPPILHITACGLEASIRLLNILRSAGFKRAGIISASKDGITLEAIGTERLEAPLKLEGEYVVRRDAIPLIVRRANSLLTRSKARIRKLEEVLRVEPSRGLDSICGERAP